MHVQHETWIGFSWNSADTKLVSSRGANNPFPLAQPTNLLAHHLPDLKRRSWILHSARAYSCRGNQFKGWSIYHVRVQTCCCVRCDTRASTIDYLVEQHPGIVARNDHHAPTRYDQTVTTQFEPVGSRRTGRRLRIARLGSLGQPPTCYHCRFCPVQHLTRRAGFGSG